MNNSIRNGDGSILGFQCWTCREVFDSMWGTKCNKCREEEKRHREIISVMKSNDKKRNVLQRLLNL